MAVQVPVPKDTFRLVRVFLASPGDLGDERRAARDAVEEINKTIARPAGFHVDLIGWEDTISDRRRPQEIINEDLQTCEMFVGMMWKKWGTPPDSEGKFTSGFSEEFDIATKLNDGHGWPIIRLYFKNIDQSLLTDPGEDLKKVIKFKRNIESSKKIYFETFVDSIEFAKRMRISVADYINKLKTESQSRELSATSPQGASTSSTENRAQDESDSSPDLAQARFLADVAQDITSNRTVSADAVARLRNLSHALALSRNDELTLQAHDANILYGIRAELQLGAPEVTSLADAGLAAHTTDNLPVWYWVADRLGENRDWLVLSTIIGSTDTRVGAFQALLLTGEDVPEQIMDLPRSDFIQRWFAEEVPVPLRVGALRYIAAFGRKEDRQYIDAELQKKKSATLTAALEAEMAHILRFEGARAAAEFALGNSFDDLAATVLQPILETFPALDTAQLCTGLTHRASAIRLESLRVLAERGEVTPDRADELLADTSLPMRETALRLLDASGARSWSKEELKSIFVRKPAGGVFGGAAAGVDWDGEAAFERFQVEQECAKPRAELEKVVDDGRYGWFLSYCALAKAHFRSFAPAVRRDFDDQFKSRFLRYVQAIRDLIPGDAGVESLAQSMLAADVPTRRSWMREAANILIDHNNKQDLERVRRAIDNDEMDPSSNDIRFLGQRGDWEDVPRIQKLHADYRTRGLRSLLIGSKAPTLLSARALLQAAKGHVIALLKSEMSGELLAAVICGLSKTTFSKLPEDSVLSLLNHKEDAVRKAAALRIVQTRNTNYVHDLAATYADQSYRFYNVIRWLDLGLAFVPAAAKLAADRELKAFAAKWS
jgi:hypothetical protein